MMVEVHESIWKVTFVKYFEMSNSTEMKIEKMNNEGPGKENPLILALFGINLIHNSCWLWVMMIF